MKVHTTNYFDTFIEVSDDTKATCGTRPASKDKKTVAEMQYELIAENPYKYSSDDILRCLPTKMHWLKRSINKQENSFFQRGNPVSVLHL